MTAAAPPLSEPVLILGGGLMGLAVAHQLARRGVAVLVLSRRRSEAAGFVAAGMLAPHAEGIGGALLALGQASLERIPAWVAEIEADSDLSCGLRPCGIVVPFSTATERDAYPTAAWGMALERTALEREIPGIGPRWRAGLLFKQDGQIDNRRRLMRALERACVQRGVRFEEGSEVLELITASGGTAAAAAATAAAEPEPTSPAGATAAAPGASVAEPATAPAPRAAAPGAALARPAPTPAPDRDRLHQPFAGSACAQGKDSPTGLAPESAGAAGTPPTGRPAATGAADPRAVAGPANQGPEPGTAPPARPPRLQAVRLRRADGRELVLPCQTAVLAGGAWSARLMPQLPVVPVKGQMLSLQGPIGALPRVVFGPGTYLVPREDGLLVVGATSEAEAGFAEGLTPCGQRQLEQGIAALLPAASGWPPMERWWGFRPCTPDEGPLLGPGPISGLWLATGHHRNGVLLAALSAELVARGISGEASPGDGEHLEAFRWDRF